MTDLLKYCPRCLRTETEAASCPNNDFPGMNCPDLKTEDPTKDVTLSCGPCDFTRVVPVRELLSGATKNKLPMCKRDECACVVVQPVALPSEQPVLNPIMPEIAAFAEAAAEASPLAPLPSATSAEDPSTEEPEAAAPVEPAPSEAASEEAEAEASPLADPASDPTAAGPVEEPPASPTQTDATDGDAALDAPEITSDAPAEETVEKVPAKTPKGKNPKGKPSPLSPEESQ